MAKSRFRLTHPIKFFIERQFVKGAKYQLLAVVALIGFISLIGGILALPTGGDVDGVGESIWWAFLRLTDPGYLGDDEGTMRRIISTFLTVSGYVVFLGALVAIMTQWLTSKMAELEQGLTPVAVKNHIVILGWTDRTHSIVVELFQSEGKLKRFLARFGTSKLQLVILAENSSAKLTRELKADRFIGKRADEIILRTGNPLQTEHLLRADCYNASAIIIPSSKKGGQDLVSADVETVKTLLSLSNNPKLKENNQLPYVVAEIQDEKKLTVAKRSYPGPLEVISGDSIISRLIAQNIRHIGLSEVYRELLSRGIKSDLYTREHKEFIGKKIYEIEPRFPNCIILGLVRTENSVFIPMLNVRHDAEIQENDRIIFLANSHDDTNPRKESSVQHKAIFSPPDDKKIKYRSTSSAQIKKVLILGWNKRIPALIHELSTYEDVHFEITIISIIPEKIRKKRISDYSQKASKISCIHVEADFMEENELRSVKPQTFNHILFMSSDLLSDGEEADARTIVGKIMLENIIENQAGNSPHVLLELANADNNHLIKSPGSEVIISPVIISHLLAQVALRRELQSIYTELFTVGGAEIEFRSLNQYNLSAGTFKFSRIEEIASGSGETAMGIYKNYFSSNGTKKLILNPSKNHEFQVTENDQFVILMNY
ncbi:ion channel DMI1 [Rhodohalobacter sp. SW132]|uniref:CASTOR/POLLUX-related putative ion channel n=1 Tax=Rhodohalobacter sp. SW132 TaxID=2293433 RepID=UPI000E25743A|nr:ion channel DMI1 [Rhodohalobacter sp. SW132]REL39096.1 ion channel DMI1 [Rhodohalobacter sp. SW132]